MNPEAISMASKLLSLISLLSTAPAAISAAIGWIFAFTGWLSPQQEYERSFPPTLRDLLTDRFLTEEEDSRRLEAELQFRRTTVLYGYDQSSGNIPCIESENRESSIVIYAENVRAPDASVEFTLTADSNAAVSLDPVGEYGQVVTRKILVRNGTEFVGKSVYLKPLVNSTDLELTLDAVATEPANIDMVYTTSEPKRLVFHSDGSGNYYPR
jgi:hypothetical protein